LAHGFTGFQVQGKCVGRFLSGGENYLYGNGPDCLMINAEKENDVIVM
jgi:hypothetical protein